MRVLVADDDPLSRRMLSGLLTKSGYFVEVVDNGSDAWSVLRSDSPPQLAILDWGMPGLSGVEICRLLREHEVQSNTYVFTILVTARDAQEDVIAGLEAGADDYIRKPFDPHELRVRLNTGRRIHQLRTDLLATQRLLEVQARFDALTGVLNRGAITERLDEELIRASREGREVSIGMIDIDHFKQVNDSHGHRAGDLVLRECVNRIHSCIRAYDALGRFGGEEFLLVVPGTTEQNSVNVFERARRAVEHTPFRAFGDDIIVTISIGVAPSTSASSTDAFLHAADNALYAAKREGRNRVVYADRSPHVSSP